jgi:CRISPR-associated protein Csd1
MSWMRNLYETYERCADAVGVSDGDSQKKMLLPVGHALRKTSAVVHLRGDGTFVRAEPSKLEICIPVSADSEGRSGEKANIHPHPLFDRIKHITGEFYRKNMADWLAYLEQRTEYSVACSAVAAVHAYLASNTLRDDLQSCSIKPDEEEFVGFRVYIAGQLEDRLWMMPELRRAWNEYYAGVYAGNAKSFCYVSGRVDAVYTEKHPKSINRDAGNAKLISANDTKNFTFRGRFQNSAQAVTVSYEASQKAHQALRWLITNYGYSCGTQAIVAWAIDEKPQIMSFADDSFDIYASVIETDMNKQIAVDGIMSDYAAELKKNIGGFGDADKLKSYVRKVAVMATDSVTSGRMSITYYRELHEREYLERVVNWHDTCKWHQPFGKGRDGKIVEGYFIGAPSSDRITETILGKKRSRTDKSYDKRKKAVREQLLHCVLDGERIPGAMVNLAVHRTSNPIALEKSSANASFERWLDWEQTLCVTCALVKGYYKKENFEVTLEDDRQDRDYLYGRLLAVADKIESAARYKQNNNKDDNRPTNAMRYMTAFMHHPLRTWNTLWEQLNPYILQLGGAGWYQNLIGDIKDRFKSGDFESDAALSGVYLLGYFAQRQKFREKINKTSNNERAENEPEQQD